MEVLLGRLNTSPEGLIVSSVGLCITSSEELRFLKIIRRFIEGLGVSSGGIISNDSHKRGVTYINPQRFDVKSCFRA